MPNWNYNSVQFTHKDKSVVDALVMRLEVEGNDVLFEHIYPIPEDQKENWYNWSIENWGTKWDVSGLGWVRSDDNTLTATFDTAWSPPIALYEKMEEQGWDIDAMYYEPGIGFIGRFEAGVDSCYEYSFDDENSINSIPEELLEFSGLRDEYQCYLEEQEEETEEWNASFKG